MEPASVEYSVECEQREEVYGEGERLIICCLLSARIEERGSVYYAWCIMSHVPPSKTVLFMP